jgi:hypothetical protein
MVNDDYIQWKVTKKSYKELCSFINKTELHVYKELLNPNVLICEENNLYIEPYNYVIRLGNSFKVLTEKEFKKWKKNN